MADQGQVEFEGCVVRAASEKALKVELADDRTVWIPRSLICDESEVKEEHDEGTLVIQEWFAIQEGLV